MGKVTKKNHYVPQVYIKNFSLKEPNRNVTLLNKNTMKEDINRNSRSILFENKLYWSMNESRGNEEINSFYEETFSKIESKASNILKYFYQNEDINLDEIYLDFINIFDLIFSMKFRNKSFIKQAENEYSSTIEDNYKDKLFALDKMIKKSQDHISEIVSIKPEIIIMKSDKNIFIGSDNPVIYLNNGKIIFLFDDENFDCVIFPISIDVAIIFYLEEAEGFIKSLLEEEEGVLDLIIRNSIEYIFFDESLSDFIRNKLKEFLN